MNTRFWRLEITLLAVHTTKVDFHDLYHAFDVCTKCLVDVNLCISFETRKLDVSNPSHTLRPGKCTRTIAKKLCFFARTHLCTPPKTFSACGKRCELTCQDIIRGVTSKNQKHCKVPCVPGCVCPDDKALGPGDHCLPFAECARQ